MLPCLQEMYVPSPAHVSVQSRGRCIGRAWFGWSLQPLPSFWPRINTIGILAQYPLSMPKRTCTYYIHIQKCTPQMYIQACTHTHTARTHIHTSTYLCINFCIKVLKHAEAHLLLATQERSYYKSLIDTAKAVLKQTFTEVDLGGDPREPWIPFQSSLHTRLS